MRRHYDYVIGDLFDHIEFLPGMRVTVPFGRRKEQVGMALAVSDRTTLRPDQLKSLSNVIDYEPLFSLRHFELLRWAADYYHYPVGEALFSALPALLRQGKALERGYDEIFTASVEGKETGTLRRAPAQQALLGLLRSSPAGLTRQELRAQQPRYVEPLKALLSKGLVTRIRTGRFSPGPTGARERGFELNRRQIQAVNAITARPDSHHTHVLQGLPAAAKQKSILRP